MMVNISRWTLAMTALLWLSAGRLMAYDEAAAPPGVKTAPSNAEWHCSRDGGKTWTRDPTTGAAPNMKQGIVLLLFRGTFEIDDPARAAGLWLRIAEPGTAPKAAICDGDLIAASGGYWKDLGYCPTLLNARVMLNGKPVERVRGPMLYFWLPVPGELRKGKNTIEVAGDCYTYWAAPAAETITARLLVAQPQPAAIYNGPLLGDFGDGYFTLACRTRMPAELTVEATPTDPAGATLTVTYPISHRPRQSRLHRRGCWEFRTCLAIAANLPQGRLSLPLGSQRGRRLTRQCRATRREPRVMFSLAESPSRLGLAVTEIVS